MYKKLFFFLFLVIVFTHAVVLSYADTRTPPMIVMDKPTITIAGASTYSTTSVTTGVHEANVQFKFNTVAGTYTGCTVQAYTTIDGINYLTFGSAQAVTVTTGTINTWTLVETAPSSSVSSTAAAGFGVYTKYKFSCAAAYGTSANTSISVIYYPNGISAQSLDPSASPVFAGLTIPTLTSTILKTTSAGVVTSSTAGVDYLGGSGTSNYIPVFTGVKTIGNSGIFSTNGKYGFGTTNPDLDLTVEKTLSSTGFVGVSLAGRINTSRMHYSSFVIQPGTYGDETARTVFTAASPTATSTAGEFDILTEDSGHYLLKSVYVDSSGSYLQLYDTTAPKVSLSTYGNSYILVGNVGLGTTAPTTKMHVVESTTLSAGITDGYTAAMTLSPAYDQGFTVTRHNYIEVDNPVLTNSAAVTDAVLFRFNDSEANHKVLSAAGAGNCPVGAAGCVKININGTIRVLPYY